ncbi:MAG: 5'/3'-nucleotidase SurE [Chloroflexota bacterium]|nr:5'/3'-nucleotidase SurE [Chloroflexota bacterium]
MKAQGAQERPHILLTNDDGIHAGGLLALVQALRDDAALSIIAPEHNWSAAGHSKTMHKPLRAWSTALADGTEAVCTSGSPSDCVALALLGLLQETPDLVIAGINLGANVGHDLTYSGTVAAAMESVIGDISAIAVSLDTLEAPDYGPAARFAASLAFRVLQAEEGEPLLLNVNVPALAAEEIKGVQITALGHRLYRDTLVRRTDPRGRDYYWIGGDPPTGIPKDGTDIGALAKGYISITPLLLDLTDYSRLAELRAWDLGFEMPSD